MRKAIIAATIAALLAAGAAQAPAVAQTAPAASDWRTIAPENLLVIDTSKGRVLVELIPVAAPKALLAETRADELMFNGPIVDHQARLRSFEIAAGLMQSL